MGLLYLYIIIIIIIIIIDRNVIQKGAEKILKYKDLTVEIQRYVECKNWGDTGNNWSDWNRFKITQKTREHRTGKS
jgi:hypothetical protein